MEKLEAIAKELAESPRLRAGAQAALDVISAAVTGEKKAIQKYASWTELDEAYDAVRLEQVKSNTLRELLRIAVSFAIRAFTERS